jgi:hypothetical protein
MFEFVAASFGEPPFKEAPPFDEVPPFGEGPPFDPEQDGFDDDQGDGDGALDADLEAAACAALNDLEAAEAAVDRLDADGTLARLDAGRRLAESALAEQLSLAAHWADLHAVLARPSTAPGAERLVRLGGTERRKSRSLRRPSSARCCAWATPPARG